MVTPLLIDYSEYDKNYRKGFAGILFRRLSYAQIEYVKTLARWMKRQQVLQSFSYLIKGHTKSVKHIIRNAAMILPNSEMEYRHLLQIYVQSPLYSVVYNGIDEDLFGELYNSPRDENMVLCIARIEGLKNQMNLIKALNHTCFNLFIIGKPAINQSDYFAQCKKNAASNIHFIDFIPQEELIQYYRKAKVHVLPSWFETCGLSTLEAAVSGCNVVITDRGYASEYCTNNAFYCDPSSPESIRQAIEKASTSHVHTEFREKILKDFTWRTAAAKTFEAYQTILNDET
ncbi:MAG: glycosyltransferase family 4 protein [Ginsengibacter sp.]